MRGSTSALSPAAVAAELRPASNSAPLDLAMVFGRVAPLEVDLGCGDGSFLSELAQLNPERDFLGVERLLGRVRGACRRIGQMELTNARIVRTEVTELLKRQLSAKSVDVFHLMFPDPWPKRRHHYRRAFTTELLQLVASRLADDGTFRVATDDADYFAHMQRVLQQPHAFVFSAAEETRAMPTSTFEKRFLERGLPIYRLVLRKISPPR